jgi:tetratricopeptide (TPR) repeat protein
MSAAPTTGVPLPTNSPPATLQQTSAGSVQNKGGVLPMCAFLLIITLAVFAQTCRFSFVNYDDDSYVTANKIVQRGLTSEGFAEAFKFNKFDYWIPLTTISHMIDCQIYGPKAGGHHMTNVLLHAASVILLFLALQRMTGALWRAAFVAAVFAVHPLHVESVSWIAERKDVLSGTFFMLAIYLYGPGVWRYCAVTACFVLGLMAKPMVITLPFVLLLLDYWPLGRVKTLADWKKPVLEKLPLILLVPLSAMLTVIAQGHTNGAIQSFEQYGLPARIANAFVSCVIYIKQTFWPTNLVVFYSRNEIHRAMWEPIAAALLPVAITAVAFIYRRHRPFLLAGWLFYLGMLVPVLGLIQIGTVAHADRYTYFPQIGLCIMLAWGAVELWPKGGVLLRAVAVLIVGALTVCGYTQTKHWKDSETLWAHTLDVNPNSLLAHNNLGTLLYQKHERDLAQAHFERALEINPKFAQAHNNLGLMLSERGQLEEAIGHFEQALQTDPRFAEAHNNIGVALRKQHKFDAAIIHFKKATELTPDYAMANFNLAKTLLLNRQFAPAADAFLAGLKLQPEFLGNRGVQKDVYDIAWTLATSPDASVRNGAKATQLAEQGYIDSHGNITLLSALAAGYAESGQFRNAINTAQQGIQLASERGESALANALQLQLKSYEASTPFRESQAASK